MKVLGLKAGGHDPGAAIFWIDEKATKVVAIAEERLTRVKHAPHAFPHRAIEYVLAETKLSPKDVDLVAYDTDIDTSVAPSNLKEEFEKWIKKNLGREFAPVRFVAVDHHDAHASTAFFCSPYEDAAVLVYDGNGVTVPDPLGVSSTETETFYRGKENTLTVIHRTSHAVGREGFPYSAGIGRLYANLSANYISFGPHNEGKMMGLAAYGDDSFLKDFPYERWVAWYNGELISNYRVSWPIRSAMAFARRSGSLKTLIRDIKNGVIARGRKFLYRGIAKLSRRLNKDTIYPDIFQPIRLKHPVRDAKNERLPDNYYSSVAYAAQKIFERFSMEIGAYLRTITGSDTLCVAGGCALNIDANRNFLTKVGFKNLFVQPASSDCGLALGCALWGMHSVLRMPRRWVMHSASLGKSYSRDDVERSFRERSDEIEWRESKDVSKETARLISEGNIIGWFQGGSEYGPRALGNRSILCDARRPDMKDILNARVKHREMWRPFAASILREKMSSWFDLDVDSPFMLLTGSVLKSKRSEVPSIVHVDGTCRLQSLTEEHNGLYWRLVKEFDVLTGTPLVLNTSFNLGGDPIVETPADAIDTFLKTDMDYLVIENFIAKKR